jgi:molybdopterin converting factor small subunit
VRITLRWFAALREQRGRSEELLEVAPGARVADVCASLGLPPGLSVAVAVNETLVGPAHVLAEGDELALLPPLGGG